MKANKTKNNTTCSIKDKEYLTLEEACVWLSVSKQTLYSWEKIGLPVIKTGNAKQSLKRYSKKHLSEFIEKSFLI